jgi:RNA polymerase sigma factor (sigma-70 family)
MNCEDALKRAVASGNPKKIREAFGEFYQQNAGIVLRFVIKATGPSSHCEDDVDEAFLQLLNTPEKILHISNLRGYVITTGITISKASFLREGKVVLVDEEDAFSTKALNEDISGQLDLLENLEMIHHSITDNEAEIILLHLEYDLSFKEIAQQMGVGEDAVFYHYKTALKKIKRGMKK